MCLPQIAMMPGNVCIVCGNNRANGSSVFRCVIFQEIRWRNEEKDRLFLASKSSPRVVPGISSSTNITKTGVGTVVSTASSSLSATCMALSFADN